MQIKKATGIAIITLGVITLTFFSIDLIITKLSLPPYSPESEGKYVAYSLRVYTFLSFILPLGVSLFLAGYLVFPTMFQRFHLVIKVLSALLAIGCFGITALITGAAIVNKISPILAVAGLSPLWITAILATLAFKRASRDKSL